MAAVETGGGAAARTTASKADVRAKIGQRIVYFALVVIGLLGIVAILTVVFLPEGVSDAESTRRFGHVTDIFTMLLPVLGTWVGTVLAFYFSKENFTAAAEQTRDLVRELSLAEKLEEIAVADVMLSFDDVTTVRLEMSNDEDKVHLKNDLLKQYETSGRNRLPIVTKAGVVKYVIHRSIVEQYVATLALEGTVEDSQLNLKAFLDTGRYRHIASSFRTIGADGTLREVKELIDSRSDCADVIVTKDGRRDSKAVGWVTNVILSEHSRANRSA